MRVVVVDEDPQHALEVAAVQDQEPVTDARRGRSVVGGRLLLRAAPESSSPKLRPRDLAA